MTTTTCAGCGIPDAAGAPAPDDDVEEDSWDDAGGDNDAGELIGVLAGPDDVEATRCFEALQPTTASATSRPTATAITRMG